MPEKLRWSVAMQGSVLEADKHSRRRELDDDVSVKKTVRVNADIIHRMKILLQDNTY